jgi:iron-sulfur cluster repair protein YtfE (RIC family)
MVRLALADRDSLPDALQVLLADYPRDAWEQDPGFNQLIQFWLERHMMFRRLMSEMRAGTETLLDRKLAPDRFAAMVSRYGGMFVNGLHEHHTVEDQYYFPKLVTKDARIAKGFEILDKDHHALDALLADFVTRANEVINVSADREPLQNAAGHFQAELTKLERLMDRHLIDEEDLIVPVILRYGATDLG